MELETGNDRQIFMLQPEPSVSLATTLHIRTLNTQLHIETIPFTAVNDHFLIYMG